jgi:hypothetical protein
VAAIAHSMDIKVATKVGWFSARLLETENIYKRHTEFTSGETRSKQPNLKCNRLSIGCSTNLKQSLSLSFCLGIQIGMFSQNQPN